MKRKITPKLTPELLNNPGSDIGILSGFGTADNPPNDELKTMKPSKRNVPSPKPS